MDVCATPATQSLQKTFQIINMAENLTSPNPARNLIEKVGAVLQRNQFEIITATTLFLVFFTVYFQIGQAYRDMPGYSRHINIFFGADHVDALKGWVPNHKGIHPLVLLVTLPISWVLSQLLPTYELAMIVFAAGTGGVAIVLIFITLRMLLGRVNVAAGVSAFYGLSMSQVVFGCIPDTYELSIISLVPTYVLTFLCLKNKKLYFPFWAVAGVMSFGITITNSIQTALCLCVVLSVVKSGGERIKKFLLFGALVGIAGLGLNLVQKGLIPEAQLVFKPDVYDHEMEYTSNLLLENPLFVAKEIGKNFFLYSYIGQFPRATKFVEDVWLKLVYYKAEVEYGWLALTAVILWLGLYLRGLLYNLRDESDRWFTIAMLLSFGANMGLHSIYGTSEIFLYTPHFSLAVLLAGVSANNTRGIVVWGGWWLLAILTGLNNLDVVQQMLEKFAVQ